MIFFGSMYIQNNEISMINFLPFTKKNQIQHTTNLKNYTWNIVQNLTVMDLPLNCFFSKIAKIIFTIYMQAKS